MPQARVWPPEAGLRDLGREAAAGGTERWFWRRGGAALIDIVLLTGLFALLGLFVNHAGMSAHAGPAGSIQVSLGPELRYNGRLVASLSLGGVWLLVYLVLVFGYYFVLETLTGQTLGKRLLALRVVRADGGRAGAGAIAVRTLLRAVDWAPALYLIGVMSMLAGRNRWVRLGDRAAGTAVLRVPGVRRRGLALVPVAGCGHVAAGRVVDLGAADRTAESALDHDEGPFAEYLAA